MESRPVNKR